MYAGFFVRLVAFIIDSIIAALIIGIVKFPFSIAAMNGVGFLKANFIFDYSFLDVLGYIGVAAYFVLLTYFAHSTPGKMLLHLEVVTKSGEWTLLNILYRETVGRFLSSILCIGYLAVLVTKEKQGFHDMLCDTYVVYAKMMPLTVSVQPVAATADGGVTNPGNISDSSAEMVSLSGSKETDKADSIRVGEDVPVVNQTPESVPVYHTVSAFQMEESHPVSANFEETVSDVDVAEAVSKSYDHINPDCTNLENLEKKN